ncbi:MAG: GDP-L-fucose synthase [Nanoarchaeota archaeon]|nr:GDP-L-fucose synthase [Nanoarchaeota archaeon]
MPKEFWKNKKVCVTGGKGFLGKYLVNKLKEQGAKVFSFSLKEYDLRKLEDCKKVVEGQEIVIHLAAVVGGIEFNRLNPGSIYFDNMSINTNILEAARQANVEKFVGIGSACAYPKHAQIPLKEENLFDGPPEETNNSYGYTKRMLAVQSKAYNKQYGLNTINLLLFNLYGPGDHFGSKNSHVIPALITKCFKGNSDLLVWGDGTPSRSFLYVEDAIEGIMLATEKCNSSDPVNIGTSEEVTIKALTEKIKDYTNFQGKIVWDTTKPNGQPRRCADTIKAKELFGFEAKTPLHIGLKRTIEWYKNEKEGNASHT